MSNKLLIISGPTATGKTALAVTISKIIPSELVSADSRQIYQGLEIGVGKDHPVGTPIHLIDIISPDKIFSASQFRDQALKIIKEIQSRGHLPILVGCSPFYIKSVLESHDTFSIKPNRLLRFFLKHLPTSVLQKILQTLDLKTYTNLNHSDVNNPRRLIRKIEISLSPKSKSKSNTSSFNLLHLSLTAPNDFLYSRIDTRVEERLKIGHLKELKQLLQKYSWDSPGLKVSAYQCLRPYFDHQKTLAEVSQVWKFREHRDARHQKTFFKTFFSAHIIDISQSKFPQNALNLVGKWYN